MAKKIRLSTPFSKKKIPNTRKCKSHSNLEEEDDEGKDEKKDPKGPNGPKTSGNQGSKTTKSSTQAYNQSIQAKMKRAKASVPISLATSNILDGQDDEIKDKISPLEENGEEPFYQTEDTSQKRGREPKRNSEDSVFSSEASSQKTPEPKARRVGIALDEQMQSIIQAFEQHRTQTRTAILHMVDWWDKNEQKSTKLAQQGLAYAKEADVFLSEEDYYESFAV